MKMKGEKELFYLAKASELRLCNAQRNETQRSNAQRQNKRDYAMKRLW
jgi:hypothetical protein